MQVQVARWGNSLGVRIPKHLVERAGLREGARVEIEAEPGRVVITCARPRYRLAGNDARSDARGFRLGAG